MSTTTDFDRHASAWLADGPTELSDRVLEAALREVHLTRQRRRWSTPWRNTLMSVRMTVAAGVAVAAVAVVAAFGAIGGGTASPSPTASAGPTALPTPSHLATRVATLDPASWTTFTSSEYGFSVGHPPDWTVTPAIRSWSFATDAEVWLSSAEDAFLAPDRSVRVAAWAVPLTDPQMNQSWPELEAWVVDYCQKTKNTDCATIHDRAVPLCVEKRDCHPALLVPFADDVQAFGYGGVLPDGKMVVMTVARGETDPNVAPYGGATRLLEAFLSTMNIWPPFYPEAQDAAATFAATGR